MAELLNHDPTTTPSNIYAGLIQAQKFAVIHSLELDSGDVLGLCPVAYKTWGRLNEARDNVLVVCHALTGSSDVSDWWRPLLGSGKAFDPAHFFIFCGNVLGSPYGSASPLTVDPRTGTRYGLDFPQTTVRDDVRAHKLVLDAIGVHSVAAVIGGSMGGMTTLEWPLCTEPGYVKSIIPIATASHHSAWGISWAETQRQCIYSDPKFEDGYYDPIPEGQPSAGLAAARMVALLTYRSCESFDTRFGRNPPQQTQHKPKQAPDPIEPPLDLPRANTSVVGTAANPSTAGGRRPRRRGPSFSAQGYLHYQGQKFVQRFDANCYLHLTDKMDRHDIMLGRGIPETDAEAREDMVAEDGKMQHLLARVPPGALVVSVDTDALFLPPQQERLAACLPGATLAVLKSTDGHDGFLLEFEQLNELITRKLREDFPGFYDALTWSGSVGEDEGLAGGSLTGEME